MTENKRTGEDHEDDVQQSQQDGGPGSHNPGGTGGEVDDPASGGVSEHDHTSHLETDVHGEPDQVS